MLTTEEILLAEGRENIITDIIRSQKEKGLRASGYSAANTKAVVRSIGGFVTLDITGPKYYLNQQYGRRGSSRKMRPGRAFIEIIRDWIRVKGIPIPFTAAGAIAYNILNKGIQVPNPNNPGGVLSDVLTAERINERLLPVLTKGIKARIVTALQKSN